MDSLLLKYIIGPSATENPHYLQKYEELQEGLLEEYSCFIYQPGDKKYTQQIVNLKVKDIRKHVYNTYLEEIFAQIDLENYVKDEIESKGIVIIDEIDKLVRAPNSSSSTKASDEGVQYDMLPLLDGTTVTIN